MNVEKKLQFFYQETVKGVNESTSKIIEEANKKLNEELAQTEKKAKEASEALIVNEKNKLEQKKNRDIMSASTEAKKALMAFRKQKVDSFMQKVETRLYEYVQTDVYLEDLNRQVTEALKKHVVENARQSVIVLMETDYDRLRKKSFIKQGDGIAQTEIKVTANEFIGGFKILLTDKNAVVDYTFAERLKEAQDDLNIFGSLDNGGTEGA